MRARHQPTGLRTSDILFWIGAVVAFPRLFCFNQGASAVAFACQNELLNNNT
jgi:hypothetical protein